MSLAGPLAGPGGMTGSPHSSVPVKTTINKLARNGPEEKEN